jgi:hypothetical protein
VLLLHLVIEEPRLLLSMALLFPQFFKSSIGSPAHGHQKREEIVDVECLKNQYLSDSFLPTYP